MTDSPPPAPERRGPDMVWSTGPTPPPPATAPPTPVPAPHRRRRVWPWLAGLAVVAVLAVVAALAIPGRFTQPPAPGPTIPSGRLPSQPPVPTPPVVAALEGRGLDCVDETYEPWLVKGCYAFADGRIVMVRMKVDRTAAIEKFQVQVLDRTVDEAARTEEFTALLTELLAAADVPADDQQQIRTAVAEGAALAFAPIGWGEVDLPAPTPTTRTITVTRSDIDPSSLTTRPVFADYADLAAGLTGLGYRCTEDGSSYRCAGPRSGEELSGAFHDGTVLTVNLWFEGPLPGSDAPLMLDAYALLRGLADPHAGALAEGLAQVSRDSPEQLFVANYRILRWEQRLEIGSVDFV